MEQHQKIILIADDDPEDHELIEDALHEIDPRAKIEKVWDGKQALTYLEKCTSDNLPCAILLDYSMPRMNGAQVLSVICNDPKFQAIPKFVWSTSNSKVFIGECLENGAMNYFVKPSSPSKLNELVRIILDSCDN